jgi:deazaflavin-dependent oxidoreductase (nitroreductase family)
MCVPDVAADGSQTLLITGSNFAGVNHPGWTYNLLATPAAEIDYRGHRFKVTAVLVPDVERERVWEVLQAQWPKYREYEVASGRKLRIFRLRAVT